MGTKLTVLVENSTLNGALKSEHGFSALLEKDGRSLLFDCGSSDAFMQNARALGIELSSVSAVALSHNHYDHTGGFYPFCLRKREPFKLYISVRFFKPLCATAFSDEQGTLRPTIGPLTPQGLRERSVETRMITENVFSPEGFEGVYLLNNIPRTTDFEKPDPTDYVITSEGYEVDRYADEQALCVETSKGLLVVTGCAHAGAVNICRCARERLGQEIFAFIGGTHLVAYDTARAERTIGALEGMSIPFVYPAHCTGDAAFELFEKAGCTRARCGFCLEIE